jgi:hypothetical protein
MAQPLRGVTGAQIGSFGRESLVSETELRTHTRLYRTRAHHPHYLLEDVLRRAVLWQAAGKQDIQCHGFHLGHRRA